MYARRIKCNRQSWDSAYRQSCCLFRSEQRGASQSYSSSGISHGDHPLNESVIRKFCLVPNDGSIGIYRRHQSCLSYYRSRYYSSKSDGSNAGEDKHVPVKDAASFDKGKPRKEESIPVLKHTNDHASLGEQDQQEWLNRERLSIETKKKESSFITKRERFKNEFLRRVVQWEKITVTWKTFPYYINEHTKSLFVECAASHLKNKKLTSSYGSRLASSSGRILLQSAPGTELYRERLVRALAHDLQVPLLVLDSSTLAPFDYGAECASEIETDDENAESEEEDDSGSEAEDENDADDDGAKAGGSDDEHDVDVKATAEALKKLRPYVLAEFERRVSANPECASTSTQSESEPAESSQDKRPLKKGDRVKYVGGTVHTEVDNRPLSSGQCGEVYEVNGDQVAIILDSMENKSEENKTAENKTEEDKTEEGNKDESVEQDAKPSIHWVDIQDIVQDVGSEGEDWYIALEALSEVLPSLQPLVVYFPDAPRWLSRAVPKSERKEYIQKLEEMFDQLPGPIVLICGQNIVETGTKEKEKCTVAFPQLGRFARLPIPLKHLSEGFAVTRSSKDNDICRLFTNNMFFHAPKEEEQLRSFNKQIEVDRRIITSRNNLIELHKVLEVHELSCMELLSVKTDGVILTNQKAEKVIGWAKNHYLSSCAVPCVKNDRLVIPLESLDIAISRLREHESNSSKPSQSLKSLAKDEYESNFVSAVVPPAEVGVKFDDIGALEEVKQTLNELVTLPMRRPELFSRGNLLRPCKGILLFGPPGTGKTLLAKALATEAGANFISITGSTLTSKWFGDAEKLTKALFSFASRLAPVIIFVDEVDSLLGARGGAHEHEATRRMRNEFMAAWDGLRSQDSHRILILGATNRPFDLDDAVIRRLPRRIYVDLPDAVNRKKILKVLLSHENLESDFKYDELARATEGYSGSDLKNLCIAAAYRPVQELLEEEKKGVVSATPLLRALNLEDFIQAKTKVGASVAYDATSMNALRKWNEQYGEGGSRKKTPFGF